MNVTFNPAATVLGVLPGGWLTIGLTLIIGYVLSRLLARNIPSRLPTRSILSRGSANVLFSIFASLVFYTGFDWTAEGWRDWARIVFVLCLLIAIVLFVMDRFRGTDDHVWRWAAPAATTALIASFVLASNLSFSGGWGFKLADVDMPNFDFVTQQSYDDLRLDFATQLNAAKVDASSLDSECKSVPHICAVINAHTEDIKNLKAEDAKLWKALKGKADTVALPKSTDSQKAADSLAKSLAPMGWTKGEVVTGNKIDWSKNRRDAGRQAFVAQTINTPAKYAEHRKGTSASDKAGTKIVTDNTPAELHASFLRGESVIPVQFTTDSCVNGNTGFDGHEVVHFDKICHEAGDIWWVPVGPDGTVYWAAAVRADCGNPGVYVAPFPRNKPAPSVCPQGTDRAGMPINKGCYDKPGKHKPPVTPPTTTPPTTTPPDKVKVCINDGGDTKYVPKSEAHKYPKPNADGTCAKGNKDPNTNGNSGNGGGNNQDTGPGPTTTPTQPPNTPRPTPSAPAPVPTATQQPAPAPETSAPQPSTAPSVCSPAPGDVCPPKK